MITGSNVHIFERDFFGGRWYVLPPESSKQQKSGRIDDLGRVVIPKTVREKLKLQEGDSLELFITDEEIIFKKYPFAKQESTNET